MPWASFACLALVPLWWRQRAARFALLFLPISWMLMALTKDAGGAAHHVVLLWPMPQMFIAAVLARLRGRWIITAVLAAVNLLVINQYLFQFARYGAAGNWTDALQPLAQEMRQIPARKINVIDWGILNTLRLSSQGQLPLAVANDPLMNDPPDRATVVRMLAEPGVVWLGHVPEREEFKGVRARLDAVAESEGYRSESLRVIPDSNGRPVFEAFRYTRP